MVVTGDFFQEVCEKTESNLSTPLGFLKGPMILFQLVKWMSHSELIVLVCLMIHGSFVDFVCLLVCLFVCLFVFIHFFHLEF